MIRIISETDTILVQKASDLGPLFKNIFRDDPNPDVTLTYVVTIAPTSRRMTTTTLDEE